MINSDKKSSTLHLVGILLAVVLILAAGWMLFDAWMAYSEPVIIIEWQTASEMDTLGFNIIRSESSEGSAETKVNTDLIPPASDPLLGESYSFKDESVQPDLTYYYWLEEVDTTGFSSRYQLDPVTAQRGGWQQALLGIALLVSAGLVLVSGSRSTSSRGGTSE